MHATTANRKAVQRRATVAVTAAAVLALAIAIPSTSALAEPTESGESSWTIYDADGNAVAESQDATVTGDDNSSVKPFIPQAQPGYSTESGDRVKIEDVLALYPEGAFDGTDIAPTDVIGDDNRLEVDVNVQPWRSVVRILSWDPVAEVGKVCSGSLYGTDDVATAGHCLSDNAGVPNTSISILFEYRPDGTAEQFCGITHYALPDLYLNDRDYRYDYGWLRADQSSSQCNLGGFGSLGILNNEAPGSAIWVISGYPGTGSIQMADSGQVQNPSNRLLTYSIDTSGGQSGSPVFRQVTGCGRCLIGIHTQGTGGPGSPQNSGVHIGAGTFGDLDYWRDWTP